MGFESEGARHLQKIPTTVLLSSPPLLFWWFQYFLSLSPFKAFWKHQAEISPGASPERAPPLIILAAKTIRFKTRKDCLIKMY